jgi:hypothetical protein
MDVGRVEATLSARFDKDPFEKYDRALDSAFKGSQKKINADLDATYNDQDIDRYNRDLNEAQREAQKGATAKLDAKADTSAIGRYKRELDGADRTQRQTETSAKKTGAGFTALASNARFLAGTAAIGGLVVAFRSMYQEQAEAQAASASVSAALKTMGTGANVTAQDVDRLSAAISRKAAVDDEAVTNAAAMMLTFKNVRNETGEGNKVFDRSIELTADIARLYGTDMTRASVQVGKALNDPIKGINALSRQGLTFTEGQKEQIKTMVESGNVMGAQKLILKELEMQVGDQAEAYGKTLPGAVDRTKIAFQNLMESLGGKIAPAVSAVADALESVLSGKAFGGSSGKLFDPIIKGAKAIQAAIAPVFKGIGDAFQDIFGGKNGAKNRKDLQEIAKAFGDVMQVIAGIVRRAVPAIVGMFRGLFTVIRGIIRVVGGILSGDWGRVWSGLKDIVSGAFRILFSIIRGVTAPMRELLARIFAPVGRIFTSAWNTAKNAVSSGVRAVVSFVRGAAGGAASAARAVGNAIGDGFDTIKSIPGKVRGFISDAIDGVRGLAGKAASAGLSVGRAVINGIGNGLSAAGSFLGNVGRGIANWINANTPFGDTIKIGPASVRLPALAQGGRVGPSLRGAQMFIAGEGGKDEWVISQEGDRAKNTAWAIEALEALTGKQVAMFRGGGRPSKAKLQKARGKLKNTKWATGLETRTRQIEQLETEYGQKERRYSIGDDEYLINRDDGSVEVNTAVINSRISELDDLIKLKNNLEKKVRDLISWIEDTSAKLLTTIRLLRALAKKGNKATRKRYTKEADRYSEARTAMDDVVPDLRNDLADLGIDVEELQFEKSRIEGYRDDGKAAPSPGGDTGGGGPGTTPATPEEIARAAREQIEAFNSSRSSLFAGFGQNFIGAGGAITPLVEASGLRYFGAGMSGAGGVLGAGGGSGAATAAGGGYGSAVNAGAGGVIITNNYAAPPPDPHTWSQGLAWEIRTAV